MELWRKIVSNGYIAILPILAWNMLFISKLPPAYHPASFNHDIPLSIMLGENVFRSIIFLLPLFFRLNISSVSQRQGLIIYVGGVALYFISWLMLILAPSSSWSNSLLGFAAPAYTPIIWLVGLGLMADAYYFRLTYKKWHYILPAVAFAIFHITHSVYVYSRTY